MGTLLADALIKLAALVGRILNPPEGSNVYQFPSAEVEPEGAALLR